MSIISPSRIPFVIKSQLTRLSPSRERPKNYSILPRSAGFIGFIAICCLAILTLFVLFDSKFVHFVRALVAQYPALESIFAVITRFGESGWIIAGCVILMLFYAMRDWSALSRRQFVIDRFRAEAATFVFFSVAVSGTLINLVKNTIGRARPKHFDELGPHYFDFAAFDASFASFPSGHSTTFGALAVAMLLLFPRVRWALLVLGILGGLSRSIVGAHYVSDIVAGLLCGGLFSLITARWLAKRGVLFLTDQKLLPHPRHNFFNRN